MKMNAPIIITVPHNYLAMDEESKVVVDVAPQPSRKRRLDHLTWEEKMQRKKLKNRVAAQTSRDRKKARMDEMEGNIKMLMEANERLSREVSELREMNSRLMSEKEALVAARVSETARGVAGAPGPAESNPQQKEGPPAAPRAARARLLLAAMYLLSQTSSPISTPTTTSTRCTNLQTNSSKKLVQILQERLKMSQTGNLESVLKQLKWWGPQQSTWNPVEVHS